VAKTNGNDRKKKKQKGNDRKKKPNVDRHKPTGNAKKPDVDRKEKNECGEAQTDVERWHRKKTGRGRGCASAVGATVVQSARAGSSMEYWV
jgi:hypothetical protein